MQRRPQFRFLMQQPQFDPAKTLHKDENTLQFGNSRIFDFDRNDFNFDRKKDLIVNTGNSFVYKSLHRPSDETLAVKIVMAKDEIREEVANLRMASQCEQVVDFYGIGIVDFQIYICMELMDFSLKQFYEWCHLEKNAFPMDILGCLTVALNNALNFCQGFKIFHRDIKPQNILLKWSGEIKLTDFGSSKKKEESFYQSTVGTIAYWPPERFDPNITEYDERSDVWSVGITLLECAVGRLPYFDTEEFPLKLKKHSHPLILVQNAIKTMKVEDAIKMISKKYAESFCKFIHECLKPLHDRIRLIDFANSELYQNYKNKNASFCASFMEKYRICIAFDTPVELSSANEQDLPRGITIKFLSDEFRKCKELHPYIQEIRVNDNLLRWIFTLYPDSPPYNNGKFKILLQIFNFGPHQIKFVTKIYHPYVDTSGNYSSKLTMTGSHSRSMYDVLNELINNLRGSYTYNHVLRDDVYQQYETNREEFMRMAEEHTRKYASISDNDEL